MINCPICKTGKIESKNNGNILYCDNVICYNNWELTKTDDFINSKNKGMLNEEEPLKNNITTQTSFKKLSTRLAVLLRIYEFEITNGRGVKFNELVDILSKEGINRSMVSLSQDSLWDVNLIEDKMILDNGFWVKVITITKDAIPFVKKMAKHVEENM
jgi:hypothetical protein